MKGLVAAGIGSRVLLINAETHSKFVNTVDGSGPGDIFGDGASDTLVGSSVDGNGVFDLQCGTAGKHNGKFIIAAGGCRQLRTSETAVAEVDLFVLHQASRMALDSVARLLKPEAEKVHSNIGKICNTISESILISLSDEMRDGKVGRGDWVLLAGFGIGLP